MSDAVFVAILVICFAVAVGGFFTGIRLVRRVRSESDAEHPERDRKTR